MGAGLVFGGIQGGAGAPVRAVMKNQAYQPACRIDYYKIHEWRFYENEKTESETG